MVNYLLDIHDIQDESETLSLSRETNSLINKSKSEIIEADGYLFIYSIIDRNSFRKLGAIRGQILRDRRLNSIPMMMVGNFLDQEAQRDVTNEEGRELAGAFGCPFLETCAKRNEAIYVCFSELVREIKRYEHSNGVVMPHCPPKVIAKLQRYSRVDSDDLKFSNKDTGDQPQIKAATLPKLIERLTYPKYVDPNFLSTFLLTYRTFTSPATFLEMLIQRFCIQPPNGLNVASIKEWQTTTQLPIRLRISNVLKTWIRCYFEDFEKDEALTAQLMSFIDIQMSILLPAPAFQLKKSYEKRKNIKKRKKRIKSYKKIKNRNSKVS